MATDRKCAHCTKQTPKHRNYCDWRCMCDAAIAAGGKIYAPNGLPPAAIKPDGNLYEHEHGDHPAYKFPVTADYIGDPSKLGWYDGHGKFIPATGADLQMQSAEVHALLRVLDGVVTTIYETTYHHWNLSDGSEITCASDAHRAGEWRLSAESLNKIRRGGASLEKWT